MTPQPVVLVLRALGLGDLLAALPALRALGDAFPGHRRLLVTDPALAPLVRLAGAAHHVVPSRDLRPLPGPLRPDVAVNLHGRGPESSRLLAALRPRRLVAFAHPEVGETAGGPRWLSQEHPSDEHEVERWCRLLWESGIPADTDRLDLEVHAPFTGVTAVHPGAAYPARRWPPERWADVARHESRSGRQVVVTGGPGEVELASSVAAMAGLPPRAVRAGRTGVLDLARLVAGAGLVLCGDTGVAHLATATRTPSVVLFGPTPPGLWGPPPDRPLHRVLWAGRGGDPRGHRPDPGLLRITVADVLAEIASARARRSLAGSS
ncbi:MAG TPA: glycosyltransferase family 9 protein [Acidimicrobiales bacterium]|nr:glycosyltransferase family 9 protein [Acidimicrobiales bacterium]